MPYTKSKTIKISLPDEIAIIIAGFFGGILPGIAIKTGVSIDPNDWAITVLKQICQITQNGIPFKCYLIVGIFSFIIAFAAFLPVWQKAINIKDCVVGNKTIPGLFLGLFLYGVGFILGILAIIKLLS